MRLDNGRLAETRESGRGADRLDEGRDDKLDEGREDAELVDVRRSRGWDELEDFLEALGFIWDAMSVLRDRLGQW